MLPEYLDRFNQTLESFRQRFPANAWSDEFSQSLINDFSFYSTRIEEEAIEYGDTIKFLKDELVRKVF